MKPVDQRFIDVNQGDCMQACLASLLEIPYEQVPHLAKIQHDGGDWFDAFYSFLRDNKFDYAGTYSTNEPPLQLGQELRERSMGIDGLYMAGGPSPRFNCGHAIIIDSDGKLIHDPHPSRLGVLKINEVNMIERLAK